ncbi:MAG TPA: hypothetical protein VM536_16470, partial [Chloroflexia bacterium]|nr:hypothetical protein [Chloroflexia bacterium]
MEQLIGSPVWPRRVTEDATEAFLQRLGALAHVGRWDVDIEAERLALRPPAGEPEIHFDWVSWMVRHPGYLRAVPHHRSF